MEIQEDLITLKTAILAKKKGFPVILTTKGSIDGEPTGVYSKVPQSLLQKWLRKNHEINVWMSNWGPNNEFYHVEDITRGLGNDMLIIGSGGQGSVKWEEALEEGLYEALKLI